jgi:ketosteroid isomerase-like protein
MGLEENKALAAELIKAVSTGDADAIRRLVAEDCKWWVMGFPRDRPLTRDQMIRGARAIIDKVLPGGFNMTIAGMTAEGDRVAVEAEGRSHTVAGKLYNNFYHFLFVLRDGKVIRAMEYTNPQHAIEVLGDVVKGLGRR